MDPRIREIEKSYLRNDLPAFAPGDTVRVRVRVVEGQKERVQPFEGVCIARRGGGVNETFTLRRVSGGVGVERIFPLHSPAIAGLEVVRRGDVRRAKLYYLRQRSGKRARVRERKWWLDKARLEKEQAEAALAAAATGEIEVAADAEGDEENGTDTDAAETSGSRDVPQAAGESRPDPVSDAPASETEAEPEKELVAAEADGGDASDGDRAN